MICVEIPIKKILEKFEFLEGHFTRGFFYIL